MSVIFKEDVMGYCFGGKNIVCTKCYAVEKAVSVLENEILTRKKVENSDKLFFCDLCEKRIA